MSQQMAAREQDEAMDRLTRGSSADPRLHDELRALVDGGHRAEALVIARESPRYGFDLLEGMQSTTLAMNPDLPGVKTVEAAKLGPLLAADCPFPRLVSKSKALQASLFVHEGVWYVLATGSAAIFDTKGNNRFSSFLVDVLTLLRPRLLAAANVGRLLRSARTGSAVQAAIEGNVDVVRLGTIELDLSGEMAGIIWSMFAAVATIERNLIVQRLVIGKINKWKRGEWVYGMMGVPPGYKLVEDRLVVDDQPIARRQVEEIISVLADPHVTGTQAARRLGSLGLTTRQPNPERRKNLARVSAIGSVLSKYRGWLPLWETGRFTHVERIALANVKSLAGVEVHSDASGSWVELDYEPGLPDGGWADPELIRAAVNNRPRARTGRAAANHRRLLGGLRVAFGDAVYRLATYRKGLVELFTEGDGER